MGKSIPLVYPEGMLFPSIFWNAADSYGSISGIIPSSLLVEKISSYGFATVAQHVQSRLASSSIATSTDQQYIVYCYDMLTKLAVNHSDTHIVLDQGLTANKNQSGDLGVRGVNDSALLESIDSKQM
eukprot:13290711-Ditylum_brightwellii.AAC.1